METVGTEAAGKLDGLIRGRKDALVPGKDSIGELHPSYIETEWRRRGGS